MQIDVEDVVSNLGIKFRRVGDSIKACCPFHSENTPSWTMETVEPYRYQCFGCKAKGNIFSLYYRKTGKSLYKALGIDKADYVFQSTVPKVRQFEEKKEKRIFSINGNFFDPLKNQEVMRYLIGRNPAEPITEEFITYYGIKYCLEVEINKPNEEVDGTFFYNRLCIPITENGNLVSMEGRSFNGAEPKVLYPKNTLVETLFDIDRLDREKPLLLAEGIFHLPTLFKAGYRNISCVFGASIADRQLELLREFEEIWYFPDNDRAGKAALETLIRGFDKDSFYVCPVPDRLNHKGKQADLGDMMVEEVKKSVENKVSALDYDFSRFNIFETVNFDDDFLKIL